MSPQIEIERMGNFEFHVRLVDKDGSTTHHVSLKQDDYTKLTGGKIDPEQLVRLSFEFLLEREPKESILSRFNLSVISRYFPEYEREIKQRIDKS